MEPHPLTEPEAFMRGRLLLALEESKAQIAATGVATTPHYFWSVTHQIQLDELRAFDRREGSLWDICQLTPLPPEEADAAQP